MTRPLYEESAAYYDLIYEPIVDYERECDLLERIFREHATREVHRVLDLGSGTGNHALVLANRGCEVVGIDRQPAFVERAREKAQARSLSPRFVTGDMRRPGVDGPFDALICMFGAFGHVPLADAESTLRGFRSRLVEEGLLVFEFWNPAGARDGHESWLEREEGDLRLVRLGVSHLAEDGQSLKLRLKHYVMRGRRVEEIFEEGASMALYRAEAMKALLAETGFAPLAMLDWDAKVVEPASETNFRILAVARREPEERF